MDGEDSALQALRALVKVLDANEERARNVRGRAQQIEALLGQGYTWQQVLSTEERPLIITSAWKWMGFYAVILLAGLQGIPSTLHEAAAMVRNGDAAAGAAKIPSFGRITDNGAWTAWFGHITPPGSNIMTGTLIRHGDPGDPPTDTSHVVCVPQPELPVTPTCFGSTSGRVSR